VTYREAILKAIRRWKGIWFHWNKSTQSIDAVTALEGTEGVTIYDDELSAAVRWLLGQSETQFYYKGVGLKQLKVDSSLYSYLNEELEKASSGPELKPKIIVTQTKTVEKKEKKKEKKKETKKNVLSLLKRHSKEWSGIEITDEPTDKPGVYKYTEKDKQTTNIKGSAAVKLKDKVAYNEITEAPEYWAELGRLVAKHKFGRCYSCAALAVYTLVMDTSYDDLLIAVVGNEAFDHQFVVVGTESDISEQKGYAIDIWQSNVDGKTPFVMPVNENIYSKGAKLACVLHPEDRAKVRDFVK
jgi:hypothetical protein